MPRTHLVVSFLAVLAIGAVRPLEAQQAQQSSEIRVDSTQRPRQLAPMVIRAEKAKASRAGVLALMEENRRLAAVLAEHDRKVEKLAARLQHLQTVVTDSVTREIATIDNAAAEARARRVALEARLAALEGTTASGTVPAVTQPLTSLPYTSFPATP